ncbi:hypothetical protein ABEW05_010748 [Botrytis cinerea]
MKIVYAALSTIEEEAIAPRRVKGVPALARHSMKNSIEKRGII